MKYLKTDRNSECLNGNIVSETGSVIWICCALRKTTQKKKKKKERKKRTEMESQT